MKLKPILLATTVLAAGGGALAFYARKPPPKPPDHAPLRRTGTHGAGIDRSQAPALAMINAPEAATPCQSAYDAITVEQAVAQSTKKPSFFSWVALHDDFIAVCQGLPEKAQTCLVPRFYAQHREECDPLKPPADVLSKLYVLAPPRDAEAPPEPPPGPPPDQSPQSP